MNKKIRLSEDQLTDLVHRILESKNKHVNCKQCDWEWDITAEDNDPYLCHMCGHRNDKKENKEGVGSYDAPSSKMEPNHTTSKREYTEQPDDEERQFVNIVSTPDVPIEKKSPMGPMKIIYNKLLNKKFVVNHEDLEVYYIFDGLSPGARYDTFYGGEEGINGEYISADVIIKKVLYKGMDVTDLLRKVTSNGGLTKHIVLNSAWNRLSSIVKNLGSKVGQIIVNLY